MNKFIRASHAEAWLQISLVGIGIVFLIVCAVIFNPSSVWQMVFLSACIGVLVLILTRHALKTGLSVENGDIYYHGFFGVRKIDPINLKACAVVKSQAQMRYTVYDLRDRNRNHLYSMVFFNYIDDKMIEKIKRYKSFYGNLRLQRSFAEHVEFSVNYDEEFVNYVSGSNPEIKIVDLRKN